jgi:hypothetical protein
LSGGRLAAIIDACESGQDHDREPVCFVTPHQRRPLSLRYYSRLRTVAPTAPRNAVALSILPGLLLAAFG